MLLIGSESTFSYLNWYMYMFFLTQTNGQECSIVRDHRAYKDHKTLISLQNSIISYV